jgi:hypothetical protein
MLHNLHTNPERLLADPTDSSFSSWTGAFSAEDRTDEIAALLDTYPELRSEMDLLVPEKVAYTDFWNRYLYLKSKIDADESRRKQLFDNKVDENDFDWDGEDEGDEDKNEFNGKTSTETVKPTAPASQPESAPRTSNSESSTSFDIVSQSSAVPPQQKVSPLYITAYFKTELTTEESDDDWE